MTKIKLCGLTRVQDIETANRLLPDYVGFVFAEKSRRYIPPQEAAKLKALLDPRIRAVGVFTDAQPGDAAELLRRGVIDMAQLHGAESEAYITRLRAATGKPIIKAFVIAGTDDVRRAERSGADYILLDSGKGSGRPFDHRLLAEIHRPYFLAGGLDPENAAQAVRTLRPFAVDVSSGIETAGVKDIKKMTAFVEAVRKENAV